MKTTALKKTFLCLLLGSTCLFPSACQNLPFTEEEPTPPQRSHYSTETKSDESESDTVVKAIGSPKQKPAAEESSEASSSAGLTPEARERKKEIECLLLKKQELKEEQYFSLSDGSHVNTYYYNDATIRDINRDGHYEMVVSYVTPFAHDALRHDSYDPQGETFTHIMNVFEVYTVQDGKAVGSGYLDQIKTVYAGDSI